MCLMGPLKSSDPSHCMGVGRNARAGVSPPGMLTTPGASVGAGAGLSGRRGDTSSTVSRKGWSSLNAERSGSGASGWLASLGGFSFVPSLRCDAGETPELPRRHGAGCHPP